MSAKKRLMVGDEIKSGNVEIRFINGKLDEVLLFQNGDCVFHFEYKDGGHVWMRVENVHVDLYSANSIAGSWSLDETPVEVRNGDIAPKPPRHPHPYKVRKRARR
jgi:hypothetical protein